MKEEIHIITGNLIFTETTEPIMGRLVPNSGEEGKYSHLIKKRILPKLDENFQPTKETYELWEIEKVRGCGYVSYFFHTRAEAEAELAKLGVEDINEH